MGNTSTKLFPSRHSSQQQQLSNDLLQQQQEQQQQHGGPLLDFVVAFLSKILPCSEILLRRLVWVLAWSWKAAPVALYESLLVQRGYTNTQDDTDNNSSKSSIFSKFKGSPTDVSQYFQTWWHKTFVIPTALGFYYFLYDNVSEPLLASVGCCSSEFVTVGAVVGLLVLHFASGVAMHLWKQRNDARNKELSNQEETVIVGDVDQQEQNNMASSSARMNSPSYNRTIDNHHDHQDWVTMEKAHAAEIDAVTDYQASKSNNTKEQMLSPAALFQSATKEGKRKLWPFGRKKKAKEFSSNAPPTTEMV